MTIEKSVPVPNRWQKISAHCPSCDRLVFIEALFPDYLGLSCGCEFLQSWRGWALKGSVPVAPLPPPKSDNG